MLLCKESSVSLQGEQRHSCSKMQGKGGGEATCEGGGGDSPSEAEEDSSSSSSSHRDSKSPGRSITLSDFEVGRTDMDWESGVLCRLGLENKALIFDFFFLSLEGDSSSLSAEGVTRGTMADTVSDALSLFLPLILSFSFPNGFRDLSFMERAEGYGL
ncbi:hypothetical protein Celaphus_00019329 [Cervus elaphus hippelaphus]|uniref:Uncharacterized protein n=1 Tax=Cervus elaphus hippelaphus TaxID=46360 RepID=A0A212C2V6_CEREH|nr:hypothetical protein Celaphus_00019329 [Cervus elaphus hippelaphus]